MFDTTALIRRAATGFALLAAAAALTVPQAFAGGVRTDGRSPDTKDAASAAHAVMLVDGRSPDTVDAATAAQASRLVPLDGRSPDTLDAAALAHSPVLTVFREPGFQWSDFGIGIAAAFGLVLLVAGTALFRTARSRQPSSVATA